MGILPRIEYDVPPIWYWSSTECELRFHGIKRPKLIVHSKL